ncbi:MAG: hypothetical protein ACYTCU_01015 [Planctomycetota bacterium]|jgi:hypothetical protein
MSNDSPPADRPARKGLFIRIRDLFSSITLGIWLLSILFVYSSIGSAGMVYPTGWNIFDGDVWAYAQIRQFRVFEMTEYEWFNWWPFNLLMVLICLNLIVATLRRIPFRAVNYGVWMIHAGIITLALGSWWYFSTKIEGDSPVARRNVVIELPNGGTGLLQAVPGARTVVRDGMTPWQFMVQSVDPNWAIMTGDDAGDRAFSVTVAVEGPDQSFMRQLLVGHPEYTEDIIRTDDPAQPMKRAVKELGKPLINEDLKLSLAYDPQEWVYLANWVKKSWSLYMREQGEFDWAERRLEGVPFYNDYIGSYDDVWLEPGHHLPLDPLDVVASAAEPNDPLPGIDVRVSSYLRYAMEESRLVAGGEMLSPTAVVRVRDSVSGTSSFELSAFDPANSTAADGALGMQWVQSKAERDALTDHSDSMLTILVPGDGVRLEIPLTAEMRALPEDEYTPIEGTGFSYNVNYWTDNLVLDAHRAVSMASVFVRGPEGLEFERWVFEDPMFTHDRSTAPAHDDATHGQPGHVHGDVHDVEQLELETSIEMSYRAGVHPAPVTVVAGPGENDLAMVVAAADEEPVLHELRVGQVIQLAEGTDIAVTSYSARTKRETRPAIVPPSQRDRDVRESRSMVKVNINSGGVNRSAWVRFHTYPFRSASENMRRFRYRPTEMTLADGRVIEMVLSRNRVPLPYPVVLDDFELTSHVGGFSGRTSSIRNWTSLVRFDTGDELTDTMRVSVNDPVEQGGFWYYQAQWDPPMQPRFQGDPPSAGLNYTVLGVGNRNGVGVQLVGCCIAVIGMLYAFYFKPILRRRKRAAHATKTTTAERRIPTPTLEPMGERT